MLSRICLIIVFSLTHLVLFSQVNSEVDGHFSRSKTDTIPKYVSGEFGFVDYLTGNFRVSQSIKRDALSKQSNVLISFSVDKMGATSDVKVENCESSYIANEFRRICTNMDGWSPAILYDEKVKVRVFIPFSFIVEQDQILHTQLNSQLIPKNKEEKATVLKIFLVAVISAPFIAITVRWIKNKNI